MMKFVSLMAAVVVAFAISTARAEEQKDVKVTGVLIDQTCAAKCMAKDSPQEAAGKHPKACAIKCADAGFAVMSDGKMTKLSPEATAIAKEYLAKEENKTTVVVEGTQAEDGTITVKTITMAPVESK
jgi:hypothetical protein